MEFLRKILPHSTGVHGKSIFTSYVQSLYFYDFFWFNEQSTSIYMNFLFLFAYLFLYTYLLHYLPRSYCGRDMVHLTKSSPWERPWLSWTVSTWCISPQTGINSFLRGLLTSAPTNRLISGDVRLALYRKATPSHKTGARATWQSGIAGISCSMIKAIALQNYRPWDTVNGDT